MAKQPKWFRTTPHYLAHPASTLIAASKVVAANAQVNRHNRDMDGYREAMFISGALAKVAQGKTWAEAFELAAIPASNKEQA